MKRTFFWLKTLAAGVAWLSMFLVLLLMVVNLDLPVNAMLATKLAVWLLLVGQVVMLRPLVAGLSSEYSDLQAAHEPFLITGMGQRA